MAKQSGLLFFEGNMGGINYYKTAKGYYARKKGGVSKSRIMKDPNYEHTRRNMEEFKLAAGEGKRIRNLFLPLIQRSADSTFSKRFFTLLLKITKTDPVHPPGSRKPGNGDWSLLEGLELNKDRKFWKLWSPEIRVEETTSELRFSWSQTDFEKFEFPANATHLSLFLNVVTVDVEGRGNDSQVELSRQFEMGTTLQGGELVVDKQDIPGTRRLYIFSIEYYQWMAGTYYPYCSTMYKGAKVVRVE
ncbi:hypothetical protein [Litoribacter populi]|uniref:hypothetical protein n=1 Tax=Litoribacter populi TaxID=2598460 RepID=UPI00117D0AD4|nr:hypothetical protein [Litoribacter populi]